MYDLFFRVLSTYTTFFRLVILVLCTSVSNLCREQIFPLELIQWHELSCALDLMLNGFVWIWIGHLRFGSIFITAVDLLATISRVFLRLSMKGKWAYSVTWVILCTWFIIEWFCVNLNWTSGLLFFISWWAFSNDFPNTFKTWQRKINEFAWFRYPVKELSIQVVPYDIFVSSVSKNS